MKKILIGLLCLIITACTVDSVTIETVEGELIQGISGQFVGEELFEVGDSVTVEIETFQYNNGRTRTVYHLHRPHYLQYSTDTVYTHHNGVLVRFDYINGTIIR